MATGSESNAPDQQTDRRRQKVGERVTIYLRGNTWQMAYSYEGQQQRRSLDTTNKKVAMRQALRVEAQLLEGTHQPKKEAPLLEEANGSYLAHLKAKGCRQATLDRYEAEMTRIIDFAKTQHIFRVNGLNRAFFDAYRVWRSPQVMGSTLYHELNLTKQFVNYLASRGWIQTNGLKDEKLKKPKYEGQVCFSQEQVEGLITLAKPPYNELFAVLGYTGMRINEALHLGWEDIDFEGGFIHVRAKNGWLPKGGENRKVPLHERIRPILVSRRKAEGLVFTGRPTKKHPQGGQPVKDRRALLSLKTALKRAGLKEGKLHSFRHAFVSMCANCGIPPLVVARWVGHSTLGMLQRYYSLSDEESLRMIQKLPISSGGDGKKS